jgi:hypothetical protein
MTPSRILASLAAGALLSLSATSCTLDSQDYENLKHIRDEYRIQIADLRQANETINRNILATYQELESLKSRLSEAEEKHRDSQEQGAGGNSAEARNGSRPQSSRTAAGGNSAETRSGSRPQSSRTAAGGNPAETRNGSLPQSSRTAAGRPSAEPESRSVRQSEDRSGIQPDGRSVGQSEDRPVGQSGRRSGNRP